VDRQTVELYESQSAAYAARRRPRSLSLARAFATRRPDGVVVDLGCGPGRYTSALGHPAVAFDAAGAMLHLARAEAPSALLVQGDLCALPFRSGSLSGAWARNSYVHLRSVDVPLALADLHRAIRLDGSVELRFFQGDVEGRRVFPEDDLPGRWFSTWSEVRLRDLIEGAGFLLDELEALDRGAGERGLVVRATRGRRLPDTVGPDMRVLVCGLNPSEHAADAGVGYVTPGNRFWPAAVEAGLVTRDRDPRHALLEHGMGMTDLVKRATPRAAALTRDEYRAGAARLDRLCAWLQPGAVCVVGLAGWRAAIDPHATAGWQEHHLGGRPVYVMPSTSGLNAATPLGALVEHLRRAAGP
jgi:TDG/mug DNA glycosylase family protein